MTRSPLPQAGAFFGDGRAPGRLRGEARGVQATCGSVQGLRLEEEEAPDGGADLCACCSLSNPLPFCAACPLSAARDRTLQVELEGVQELRGQLEEALGRSLERLSRLETQGAIGGGEQERVRVLPQHAF